MPNIKHAAMERILTASDINHLIETLIGDDTPLCAVEFEGDVYLLDGGDAMDDTTKVLPDERTRQEMLKTLYDYAVHFGYTNEDFGDFVGA